MTHHRRTFLATVAALGITGCTDRLPDRSQSAGNQSDNGSSNDGSEGNESNTDQQSETLPDKELLFDFQDINEWDLVEGNLTPDREQYVTGDLSTRFDVGRDPINRIERTNLELDLTEYRPSITAQLHSSVPSQAVDIIATDTGGNDMRFRTRFYKTAEDTTFMPLDLGIYQRDEEIDLSSIQTLRLQSRFNEGDQGTLWVDSIHLVPIPSRPKLMIQWDDGFASQYTEALPIQDSYNIPATTFINTTNLGEQRLTPEQLTELQNRGWDVSSHLMTHTNLQDLSEREQEAQIRGAKDWLVNNGFEEGAEFFTYPYGTYDQSGHDLVNKHHTYAMVGGDPGYGMPRNPAHVGRSSERTLEDAQAYIDTLVEWGGIGALFWHEIPGETPVEEFDAIMSYIAERRDANDIDVITLSDLAEL